MRPTSLLLSAASIAGLLLPFACGTGSATTSPDSVVLQYRDAQPGPGDGGRKVPSGRPADAATGQNDGATPATPNSPDGSTPLGDASTVVDCTSSNTCEAARSLGTISGDTASSGNLINAEGTTSEWLTVSITEDSNSSTPMKLLVTLKSDPASDFDLYVYVPGSSGTRECAAVTKSSTNSAGQLDVVSDTWGDSFGSNDSRTLSIEVRHTSGSCSPNAKWSIEVKGAI